MENVKSHNSANYRKIFREFKSELVFGGVLWACLALSCWLAHYIPADLYCSNISFNMDGCIVTICLAGVWLFARHIEGMRTRIIWIATLLIYAAVSIIMLIRLSPLADITMHGFISVEGWRIALGDFLLWLLLLYPTEELRPGWLTTKRAILQCLPIVVAFALDVCFDLDLRILLAIYPLFLLGFLIRRIVEYIKWCEENYSSMEHIEVQWIVRYIIMFALDCTLYIVYCFDASIATTFTHQWLLLLLIGYSSEQILFRKDPWSDIQGSKKPEVIAQEEEKEEVEPTEMSFAEYRKTLDEWMNTDKPYLNPEFRLLDLRQILPLNRTYLSQLINSEYGCNFYQFVTKYRIEEAKKLMREHPDMKMQDVGEQCGFSSPTVFARIFARETNMTPSEWKEKNA